MQFGYLFIFLEKIKLQDIYKPPKQLNSDVIKQFYILADAIVGNFSYKESIDFFKECLIYTALERANFINITAAKLLGVSRRILEYNKSINDKLF